MTIGVVKPGIGLHHGGFRTGGRNLGRTGPAGAIRHRMSGFGAGQAFSLQNRLTRASRLPGVARLAGGVGVTIEDVRMFFSAYLILKKTFNAELRFLDRMGSYIATDARRSMRSGRRSKKTGKRIHYRGYRHGGDSRPPNAWPPKDFLRKFMSWWVDPIKEEVHVGPILLPSKKNTNPVPGLHEHGGVTFRTTYKRFGDQWVRSGQHAARYPKRPYMYPSLIKNIAKSKTIKNSIR
jgi:hypothetical protein